MTAAADENMPVDVGEGAQSDEEAKLQILKGAAFLTTVASAGMLAGFGSTLALAKKKSPGWFSKVQLAPPRNNSAHQRDANCPKRDRNRLKETQIVQKETKIDSKRHKSSTRLCRLRRNLRETVYKRGNQMKRRRARKAESGARAWRCCSHWRALKAGLLSLTVWKVLGVHSLSEFRQKMQSIFPSVPKTSEAAAGSQHLDWDSVFSSK
ncbi:transmembrane protein 242 [Perca fluviatilis]|uniref:transmembrane protein 242 n=1 Tax=Perca fluviatilis TaxID=8168 RepID=UPI001964B3D9|nr:transmembrane protein 242 [Perca fluviatilis]